MQGVRVAWDKTLELNDVAVCASGQLPGAKPGSPKWRYAAGFGAAALVCMSGLRGQDLAATIPAASTSTPIATVPATVPAASVSGSAVTGVVATPQVRVQEAVLPALSAGLTEYAGKTVEAIQYVGVAFEKTDKLTEQLTQKSGAPLDVDNVRQTTRRLFATGRYRNIAVRVQPTATGVVLIFAGVPQYYVGRVEIDGVKEDRLTSLLEFGTKLQPGFPFTDDAVTAGTEAVKQVLAQNGYYEPTIAVKTVKDDAGQQVNVTYTVAIGPLARVGEVTLIGTNPGITLAMFRKKAKLKRKTKVSRETTSTALFNLRNVFQKKDHLEATVTLQKSTYDPAKKTLNYDFNVEQGPIVQVKTEGLKVSKSRLHLLIPVFEEGTVDNDLVNEGTHNLRDFLQQQGYFDADVKVQIIEPPGAGRETVLYVVDKGNRHRVVTVAIKGNKYFTTDLLQQRLQVQKADLYRRSGRFSNALVTADQNSIQALYRANGFSAANVTSDVNDSEDETLNKVVKTAKISVVYTVEEGPQQTFGAVAIQGAPGERVKALSGLLNSSAGQPFSLITLSGDRDAILAYYLANGFDQAKVEVAQTLETADKTKTDVSFNVREGEQVFIGKVLESGIHYTKPRVVNDQLRVQPGEPLDQSALLETQRNLYNLALFNEVVAAVQNPTGDAEQKNVLVQITEARRWDVMYGFGLEAQTGTPACGTYCTQKGTTKAQQGNAGVSPRVSVDIGRINLLGTQDSLTLHATYGLLERIATLSFQNPHLYGSNKFALQISGGYSNVQNITTFASSKLQADVRVTHKATRRDTFIYNFQYRRVAVDPNSLEIDANLIPLLSQPVRVAGPGVTWFHDTRTPSPLDAVKGSYTSVDNFYASAKLGSQTEFNRTDLTNSTYYQFGKGRSKYVFARNTRLGFIASFGSNPNAPTSGNINNPPCGTSFIDNNPSCNSVPLPERLYAGGATSHRGFPINGAGPRDLQTGYPVGGSAALVNTFELRLPPPVLPFVGDSVSFVLFHDMGNVFQHVGDVFPSIARFHQPNEQTCENVKNVSIGTCSFNYFSHAVGVGARYRTPVGPIRVDLSVNLNPPRYPVIPQGAALTNGTQPYVGQGSRFNFFFSIGQSF